MKHVKRSQVAKGPGRARGYALMVVLLLSIVGVISATMILEQQGVQRLAEERSVEAYRAHHEQQGLSEVIEMWWLRMGKPPALIGDAPVALYIRGEHGEEYRIEMSDAQGRVLENADLATDPVSGEIFARVAGRLKGERESARFLRRHGPPLVNVNAAAREVLTALAEEVEPRGPAGVFADAVIRTREDKQKVDPAGLRRIITEAGFKERATIDTLAGLFTTESSLRRVEVLSRDPVRKLIRHHEGLLVGAGPGGAGAGGAGLAGTGSSQPWAFLTWERKNEEDSGQDLGVPRR